MFMCVHCAFPPLNTWSKMTQCHIWIDTHKSRIAQHYMISVRLTAKVRGIYSQQYN